ncbi:MAG: M28 family peptidase [Candidatus Bathyarchaeota archaeon]|nr:M28 family peptidase [Candidatus Bathyarchaeota archaeon]
MSDNPYLEADKKVVSEIYTSSEPIENLKTLCDVYGSRFGGTPGDFGSVEWMVEKLRSYGIDNAHYETFKFPGWIRGPARLEVTSPIEREIDCISLPHGLAGQVEARLVSLGDGPIDVYEERKDEIEGSIVMVTSRTPLGMTRPLHRSEKYMRSILAGAKGWVFMNHYPAYGPPTGGISPIIPSVGVSHEDGSYLARLLEREGDVTVRIKTTDRNAEMTSYNVVCDIPGTSDDEEYVLSGSHYDGHDISQGAVDPASGAVTVLEMARVLNMVKDELKRRVRLVCFGVEEIGLFGSYNYVVKHGDEMEALRFMLNLDSAGREGKKGVILHGHPELEPFIEQSAGAMRAELPCFQRVSPYSDHWPFFLKGVPTAGGGDPEALRTRTGRGYGHTRYDTVDKVEPENLRRAAANYSRLLLRAANADDWPARRKTKEEIEAFIEEQGYDQTVALVNMVKAYVRTWSEIHPDTLAWLERKSNW